MSRIERFEDIKAWQMAKSLCMDIYALTNLGEFAKDFAFKDQIRRASLSVVSNIAEGFERNSRKAFIHFLMIAKGSCGEVRAQLHIAYELKYTDKENYTKMIEMATDTSKTISGFANYLANLDLKSAAN